MFTDLRDKKTLQLLKRVSDFIEASRDIDHLVCHDIHFTKTSFKWGRKAYSVEADGESFDDSLKKLSEKILITILPDDNLRYFVKKGGLEFLKAKKFYKRELALLG